MTVLTTTQPTRANFAAADVDDVVLREIHFQRHSQLSTLESMMADHPCQSERLLAEHGTQLYDRWVTWEPGLWWALTQYQRNLAAIAVRELAADGFLEVTSCSPRRIGAVRLTPAGLERVKVLNRRGKESI